MPVKPATVPPREKRSPAVGRVVVVVVVEVLEVDVVDDDKVVEVVVLVLVVVVEESPFPPLLPLQAPRFVTRRITKPNRTEELNRFLIFFLPAIIGPIEAYCTIK